MTIHENEWLETNGLGGYASGTVANGRTRKYHGLLCAAISPPTNRVMLVNDLDIALQYNDEVHYLTRQNYINTTPVKNDVVETKFTSEPWPTWEKNIKDFGTITQEVVCIHNSPTVLVKLTVQTKVENWKIIVRPMLSGRSHHEVNHTNNWQEEINNDQLQWQKEAYNIYCTSNAIYTPAGEIYNNFYYEQEQERGYDYTEDCYSPGYFTVQNEGEYFFQYSTTSIVEPSNNLLEKEKNRRSLFNNILDKYADQFIVQRSAVLKGLAGIDYENYTIIAGYPWFTDWGRDTFIAMRGLLIAKHKWKEAESILVYWSKQHKNGLLPNRFIDETSSAEYNTIDAPLWYIIAVYEFLTNNKAVDRFTKKLLTETCTKIIDHLTVGTNYNITMTEDCLLYGGEDGVQLTWMDAKYGDHVITPRIGKPVEIQCLWINALWIASAWNKKHESLYAKALESFNSFWNEETNCLYDNIDGNTKDPSIRCNQLLAIGGLPLTLVNKEQATLLLNTVTEKLVTPKGIRTLSYEDKNYEGEYKGSQEKRDTAYHQGTVWPWWIGPYIDAYFYTHEVNELTKTHVQKNIIQPLYKELAEFGIGGICEVASGNEPHQSNGCPWQAWSLGEYIRIIEKYNLHSSEL